jgi:hypothetical protein
LEEFKRCGPGGKPSWTCIPCFAHNKKEAKGNGYSMKDTHLRSRYGITEARYNEMNEEQQGLCAICHKPNLHGAKTKELYVDHCHDTKKVRGLLCNHCNRALGLFGDNITSLERAILYLKAAGKT